MADEYEIAAYYERGNEEGRLGDWGASSSCARSSC
jgi:hypothetical protein